MAIFHKAALLAAALALSGCAGMGPGHPHGHGAMGAAMAGGERHEMHGSMMGMSPLAGCHGARADANAQLESLHTSLAITPAQESAWGSYAEAPRTRGSYGRRHDGHGRAP